jgi:phenylacetate-CoA ligase
MIKTLKYLAHRRARPQRYRFLKPLLVHETFNAAQLRAYQQQQFSAMVHFAREHTAFYRQHFAEQPAERVDASTLPILTKAMVTEHRDAMVAGGLEQPGLKISHTGGSTGQPLAYYYTDEKIERMRAGMMRSYRWAGWRQGDKVLNFWGARHDIKKHRTLADRLRRYVAAEQTLGAWEFDENDLQQWVKHIRHWRPVLLQGYASILAELATHVTDNKLRLPRSIKGVFSTAEVLYDRQRSAIETAFGCPVYNQYGCREVPNIATQCIHGNLHIFSDLVKLESVPVDGEDRLLVTSLTNHLMPMIRYEVGDLGRLSEGECPCGSPFPLLELDVCRSNDLIVTPGGRKVYPSYFVHLLDGQSDILRYQFRQLALNHIQLQLCAPTAVVDRVGQILTSQLQHDLGQDMRLSVEHVDNIPRARSGKHRFVIGLQPDQVE